MRICTLNRYFTLLKRVILMALMGPSFSIAQENQPNKNNKIHIVKTTDFEISGKGTAAQWDQTNWVELTKRGKGRTSYETRAKIIYSETGIYCLFQCKDNVITSTLSEDFADLWTEDVVEIFFWPDEEMPVYFEYELSPRNYELPILVPNKAGSFLGWRPWKYEGERLVRHKTSIASKNDSSWTAEFFIPYSLLKPLIDGVPEKGAKWRMNMYRLDYDDGQSRWSWQSVRTNFHDYESYGTIVFD